MSYDYWLERPYIDAAADEERYERFCEDRGYDYDDPEAEAAYEREVDSWYDD